VVEAARRSGALNTARHCVTLQRPLMAVPGSVDSPMSAGCHDLLRREDDPALLVTCAEDVLAVVGSVGEGLALPGSGGAADPGSRTAALDLLDLPARRVFDGLLTRRFSGPDEIATRSGVRVVEVLQALPELELAGLVESAGGLYRVAARRPASA
jgi:DNA processing protein